MRKAFIGWVLAVLVLPGPLWAVETAPALTDREIVERLTRLEAGQTAVRAEISQLREDMTRQNQHLREDMNLQFARQFRLTLALLGVFSALVAAIIGFALWDRRTMLRPLERSVTSLTEDLSSNRQRLEALVDALRTLGQRNPEVAGVLKQFNLL